jgi:hypothetical protein
MTAVQHQGEVDESTARRLAFLSVISVTLSASKAEGVDQKLGPGFAVWTGIG